MIQKVGSFRLDCYPWGCPDLAAEDADPEATPDVKPVFARDPAAAPDVELEPARDPDADVVCSLVDMTVFFIG